MNVTPPIPVAPAPGDWCFPTWKPLQRESRPLQAFKPKTDGVTEDEKVSARKRRPKADAAE